MASIITATTTSGLTQSADNSGVLQLASGTGNLVTVPSVTGTAMVSGNMPAFSAYKSSASQSMTTNVFSKVTFETETFDTNNNFASSTFTPSVAGYYQLNATADCGSASVTRGLIAIYKNGSLYKYSGLYVVPAFSESAINISDVVYLNGSTDYVEIYVRLDGGTVIIYGGGIAYTYFSGSMVRAA